MTQYRQGAALDIVGNDKVATAQQRTCAAATHQGD